MVACRFASQLTAHKTRDGARGDSSSTIPRENITVKRDILFPGQRDRTDAGDHWGGQFKLEILAEVNLLEAKGRDRLDSNWFTYADSNKVLPSDAWIPRYWRGEPYPGKRSIWEAPIEGKVEYDEFYMKESKPIIDEIDRVFSEHYGFTDEELDFIINYDIKYRTGREALKSDA